MCLLSYDYLRPVSVLLLFHHLAFILYYSLFQSNSLLFLSTLSSSNIDNTVSLTDIKGAAIKVSSK